MHQLEQALQKARKQRAAINHTRFHNGATSSAASSIAVAYTQTKTVSLTPSVLETNRVIAAKLDHPLTDVYRALRTQVLQALKQLNKSTLGITSTKHGEGKTLTAVNLAIAIAMDVNQTVLLVDADLRHPGVADCLGIKPSLGLSDCLTGKATISDCLILASPQMSQLTRELKNRYPDRLIIYDLPPVLTLGDTIGFLPSIETTLLVVRDGVTRAAEFSRVLDLLSNRNLIGTVLNAAT